MKNLFPLIKRALQTSAIVTAVATALTGRGRGGSAAATGSGVARDSAPQSDFLNLQIDPHHAPFEGKTYSQWEASFWQRALALSRGLLTRPFAYCTRPISAAQSGNVWYRSAPDISNKTLCRIRSERAHTSDVIGRLSQCHRDHQCIVAVCSAHRFRFGIFQFVVSTLPLPYG
jgi:hypothetical protein